MNRFTIFSFIFGICWAKTVEIIPQKLYEYQKLTGISNDQVYAIYEKATTGGYKTAYPKFRYHLSSGPGEGTVNPVKWNRPKENIKFFRIDMR